MTAAADPKPPATEIREAPRELLSLVCAMRPDWDWGEAMTAIQACRTAGFEWPRIARGLVNLALKDENPPTRPVELWDGLRGVKAPAGTVGSLDPQARAEAIARCAEAPTNRHRTTGSQPALWESGPLEVLHEGWDP